MNREYTIRWIFNFVHCTTFPFIRCLNYLKLESGQKMSLIVRHLSTHLYLKNTVTFIINIYNVSSTMSVCPSVCLKLRILVTTEPIRLYFSGNIPTGLVMLLSYFLGGWDTPYPPKKIPAYYIPML